LPEGTLGQHPRSVQGRYSSSYRRNGLLARFGVDIALPDLLVALSSCERRKDFSLRRAARLAQADA
jgi:hypothetical protein